MPSAKVKTLGKTDTWPKSVYSGTKMASLPSVCAVTLDKEGMSAECQRLNTRRRDQKLGLEWPVFAKSVWGVTLDKHGLFAECL